MRQLLRNLPPRDRVLRLVNIGVLSPGRLSARANVDVELVKAILGELHAQGLLSKKGRKASPCLLADVWRTVAA